MTDLRAVAQQALEALEMFDSYVEPLTQKFGGPRVPAKASTTWYVHRARDALRAALAQQEPGRAAREKVAHWMRSMGYATGHGDTIEDLLDHLGTQIAEGLLMEREACAKVCEDTTAAWTQPVYNGACMDCAVAIRARSKI